jgi:hypothetical protein
VSDVLDTELLQMALIGYEAQRLTLEKAITEIQKELGHRPMRRAADAAAPRRTMSAAARRRIAAGQRKRWAAYHTKSAKPKRTLSPAARAKLAANLTKARAAKAAKAVAAS